MKPKMTKADKEQMKHCCGHWPNGPNGVYVADKCGHDIADRIGFIADDRKQGKMIARCVRSLLATPAKREKKGKR